MSSSLDQVDVLVIGAGMGGLSAAIAAAAAGLRVRVVEAAHAPGGKMGTASFEGVEFDTGPSLLTMIDVVERVFKLAGTRCQDELELVRFDPAFRYIYPDGLTLDIYHELDDSIASISKTLGAKAAQEYADFMAYSRQIWEAARPNFIDGQAPNFTSIVKLGATRLKQVMAIDPLRSMWQGIERHVSDEHLRTLLARYATYNGSNPYEAPATLNCIAWVEQGLGGWGIKGGMAELPRALERVARRMHVEFVYHSPVQGIDVDGQGKVTGITLSDGSKMRARAVVANADASHVADALLPRKLKHDIPSPQTRSMSGWTAILKAKRRPDTERVAHTVLFSQHYRQEFDDIFDRERPPLDPTVYLCAQAQSHQRQGWADADPVFIMANAPALSTGARAQVSDAAYDALKHTVLDRMSRAGLLHSEDQLVWERTPSMLAQAFPGSYGSIYGAASNSQLAAFKRPANAVRAVAGLYLASGSAHPGGGVPLCLMSGYTAAQALCQDLERGHAFEAAMQLAHR